MAKRVCVVSFRDVDGMEHAVKVTAGSLDEAAALGLQAFRSSASWTQVAPGRACRLRVEVKAIEARHEVRVDQLETWLAGGGKSPREEVLKERLRKVLGSAGP